MSAQPRVRRLAICLNPPGQRSVMPEVDCLGGRRHELGSDWIHDCRLGDAYNLLALFPAEMPPHHLLDRIELIRATSAPQRGAYSGPIQHPSERQVDDPLAVLLASEA